MALGMKLQWPANRPLLEPNAENRLVMQQSFFALFTQQENWTTTTTFVDEHPVLAEGMPWAPVTDSPTSDLTAMFGRLRVSTPSPPI